MAINVPTTLAQDAMEELAPIAADDALYGNSLATYVGALCDILFQEVQDYAGEGPNGEQGWSILVDINRIPAKGLPWLAQFLGVVLPTGLTEAQQRAMIQDAPGWKRGTRDAIIAALRPTLTGNQTVIFRERSVQASATYPEYGLRIITYTSQTPDSAASLAAILTEKPAGIILNYAVLTGQDYQSLLNNHATYSLVFTTYLTYEGVVEEQPGT